MAKEILYYYLGYFSDNNYIIVNLKNILKEYDFNDNICLYYDCIMGIYNGYKTKNKFPEELELMIYSFIEEYKLDYFTKIRNFSKISNADVYDIIATYITYYIIASRPIDKIEYIIETINSLSLNDENENKYFYKGFFAINKDIANDGLCIKLFTYINFDI